MQRSGSPTRSSRPPLRRYFGPVPSDAAATGALTRIDARGVSDLAAALPRPVDESERPVEAVRRIIERVRRDGDSALLELTEQFDGVTLEQIRVPSEALEASLDSLDGELRAALELARDRIEAHHRAQMPGEVTHEDSGVAIRSYAKPVSSAGCYVPGGRASYPSTLLMTAVPARVAGVERVVVCVPPDRATGSVAPVTLAAAAIAGVDEVFAVGGAQAIAALAYGTESIAPVDVVCGPGNLYVAVAKQEVASTVGIAAAFAGPSEVVVVADDSVDPDLAAIDVMLQAEHGPDGLAWFVTWDEAVADAVTESVIRQTADAPRRDEIAATLERSGYCVLVDSPAAAIEVSDLVAPEHLELLCRGAGDLAAEVHNAGAIFCGAWSPASIGDYLAGPSHVLPTHGSARFASALTVDDFLRHHHVVTVSEDGLEAVGPATAALAEAEGLDAHAQSVRLRLQALGHHGEDRGAIAGGGPAGGG
jgi:histidinol dehydrogenase